MRREKELEDLLRGKEIKKIFLVETDSTQVQQASDYTIKHYKTMLPQMTENERKIRRICLVHEALVPNINDLDCVF